MNQRLRIQILISATPLSNVYSLWTSASVFNSLRRLRKAMVRVLNIWPYATSIRFWKHQSSVEVIMTFRKIIQIRSKTLLMHILYSSNKTPNTWKIEEPWLRIQFPKTPVKQISPCRPCLVRLSRLSTLAGLAGLTVLLIVLLIVILSSSSRLSHRGALRHLSSNCLLPHNTNKGVIVVRDSAVWARTNCST